MRDHVHIVDVVVEETDYQAEDETQSFVQATCRTDPVEIRAWLSFSYFEMDGTLENDRHVE